METVATDEPEVLAADCNERDDVHYTVQGDEKVVETVAAVIVAAETGKCGILDREDEEAGDPTL